MLSSKLRQAPARSKSVVRVLFGGCPVPGWRQQHPLTTLPHTPAGQLRTLAPINPLTRPGAWSAARLVLVVKGLRPPVRCRGYLHGD
jgi:hypothetical protein